MNFRNEAMLRRTGDTANELQLVTRMDAQRDLQVADRNALGRQHTVCQDVGSAAVEHQSVSFKTGHFDGIEPIEGGLPCLTREVSFSTREVLR